MSSETLGYFSPHPSVNTWWVFLKINLEANNFKKRYFTVLFLLFAIVVVVCCFYF